jgi:hypothetical protein
LDNIVYANYLFSDERILTLIQEIVLSNLSYTHYFYVPIEFAIEADGRSLDVDFQKKVDLDYLNLLNELNIDYVEVCGSVENRLGLISETLRLEISEQNFIKA